MKKRLLPALSIGIAVILIGSLAYAADRKKKSTSINLATDIGHEEEALKTELLNALEIHDQKPRDVSAIENGVAVKSSAKKEQTKPQK